MDKTTRLLVFQRIFFHYRKAFYDSVAAQTSLTLVHGKDSRGITNERAGYAHPARQVSFPGKLKYYFSKFLLVDKYDVVVLDFAIQVLNLPILIWYYKMKKKKVLLWSHGYDRKKGFDPANDRMDRYRKMLINWSDGLMVYSTADSDYLRSRGISKEMFVINNTLHPPVHTSLSDVPVKWNSSALYHLVFMGRMTRQKDPALMIRMFSSLPEQIRPVTAIHFIGEGPALQECLSELKGHAFESNFIFHDALYDEMQIGKILSRADLLIIPGAAGLAVNHALLYGVPVIAFTKDADGPFHGPEEEHILAGKTGFWVKKNDLSELGSVIYKYLNDPHLKTEMKAFIGEYARTHLALERMTEAFFAAIDKTAKAKA